MRQTSNTFTTDTKGPGLYDITREVVLWVNQQGMTEGLLTLFMRHTSASLTIQENADPDVCHDLQDYFSRIAPRNGPYRHSAEGPDDMPAHIKTALTQTNLSIPLVNGRLALGTWQGIYVFEHRDRGHSRQLAAHLSGD
jgi:secondary thiamine-phosphate synthase enzyme